MKFVNVKTCQGLESYLMVEGTLVRLSLLPEWLKHLSAEQVKQVFAVLENKKAKAA